MKKNVAVFNSDLVWQQVVIKYDQISGTYLDSQAILSIHYQTSDQGIKTNKLKVGQVTVSLSKLLNSKSYRINTQYSVEKCYDSNAKLKMGIDLTQVEQEHNQHYISKKELEVQYGYGDGNRNLRQSSSMWKVSKIRQKMNQDEKVMLQNKLYQYEQKVEKYRDTHSEQLKRLTEQIQRKQQKISSISSQNLLLNQSLQSAQSQIQKLKTKCSTLQKQVQAHQQSARAFSLSKQALTHEVANLRLQNEELTVKIEQNVQAKQKKQAYYKQELQKYTQRYMESENSRNKVVFELQNKLKQQMVKKDNYYSQLLSKLQSKLQSSTQSSKQSLRLKQKQLLLLSQKQQKTNKSLTESITTIQSLQLTVAGHVSTIGTLNETIASLNAQLHSLESQSELSGFSNASLQKELARMRAEGKICGKSLEQARNQIQMANKTIEELEAVVVKLNRNIKMHQQRQYYMQQKYQDQLQIKTYNEQCIKGNNNYYKNIVRKLQVKNKFLQQKIEDLQCSLQAGQKQQQKLQLELQNQNKLLFENSHQLLKLQAESKKLGEKCQESQFQCNQKQVLIRELQRKINEQGLENQRELNQYIYTVGELEKKIKQLSQRRVEQANQWELRYNAENLEKHNLLSQLEAQVTKLRTSQTSLKSIISQRQDKCNNILSELQDQKDKNRNLQRQLIRMKFQVSKYSDQRQSSSKQQSRLKSQLSQTKNQLSSLKLQFQKQARKQVRQKQSYVELIKWILDRVGNNLNVSYSSPNVGKGKGQGGSGNATRQFVKQASSEIQIELISFVNTALERVYALWDKNWRNFEEIREENQTMLEQIAKNRLQIQYQEQFGRRQKNQTSTNSFQQQWQIKLSPQKFNKNSILQPIVDLSNSYQMTKIQQLKIQNSQLQRDLSSKASQAQSLNQQIFQQKMRTRQLTQQNHGLKLQIQELSNIVNKKNSQIAALQAQLTQRQLQSSNFSSSYGNSRQNRTDYGNGYRQGIQAKFKEQRAVTQLQSKLQQYQRQNTLIKSKLQLLQSKNKMLADKTQSQNTRLSSLQKSLKQKQQSLKSLQKQLQQQCQSRQQALNQLQLSQHQVQKLTQQLHTSQQTILAQQQKIQLQSALLLEKDRILGQKQRAWKQQAGQYQKEIMGVKEMLSAEKLAKDKLGIQMGNRVQVLQGCVKDGDRRIILLQGLVDRAKTQNEEISQKQLNTMAQLGHLEQNMKDMKMRETMIKNQYNKKIAQLQEILDNKQFQLEQLKFSSQSKIMELERRLEQRQIIEI